MEKSFFSKNIKIIKRKKQILFFPRLLHRNARKKFCNSSLSPINRIHDLKSFRCIFGVEKNRDLSKMEKTGISLSDWKSECVPFNWRKKPKPSPKMWCHRFMFLGTWSCLIGVFNWFEQSRRTHQKEVTKNFVTFMEAFWSVFLYVFRIFVKPIPPNVPNRLNL